MATPSEVRIVETHPSTQASHDVLDGIDGETPGHLTLDSVVPGSVHLIVVGKNSDQPGVNGHHRHLPLLLRGNDETDKEHAWRVALRVERAINEGATHLLLPAEHLEWLYDNPLLVEYLANSHRMIQSSSETGIVFSLQAGGPLSFDAHVSGWQVTSQDAISLVAVSDLVEPMLALVPTRPVLGRLRGRLAFTAHDLRTLRLTFVLARPKFPLSNRRHIYLSLDRPGFILHDLPFVSATFQEDGNVCVDFDLELLNDKPLLRIEVAPIEEDNWRLHPAFPGGKSFKLPDLAPAGSQFALHELTVSPIPEVRQGSPHGIVEGHRPAPYRKPQGVRRDAVIFSSWVPEEGLVLGDYFIDVLRRWHGDSKIFVGINHGSSPQWRAKLERSGLDLTIQEVPSSITMACDPAGFAAALDAYRRHPESFDLVWFGHTKGLGHLDRFTYGTGRWTIERMYWSRREQIESYFANPIIGVYSPHYLMMLQGHLEQTDALRRMYRGTCEPLGAMAVSTHYVMREEIVRHFCERVDRRFFLEGAGPFGGNMYFCEMALPNIATMQGYEPYIEPGCGGTSLQPKIDGVESILADWRQNNAVVVIELEKWRRNPSRFRTGHSEHNMRV